MSPMDTHFAVLPKSKNHITSARFISLPHPRTAIPSLFLLHGSVLEVQAVDPPNPRSWFNGDEVVSDGKLLVITPVDPLFLLIPILRAVEQPNGGVNHFRPAEDILEDAARRVAGTADASVVMEDVLKFASLDCTQKAMKRLCDVKEITAEITVFRYSSEKLVQELRKKVASLSTPRIMDMSRCLVRSLAKDALMDDRNEDLLELGRTKLACELLGQYLPQDVHATLLSSYDLSRLDAHVKALTKEQTLVAPENSTATKTTISLADGDSKKRKKDSRGSYGVEKLKKVNVSGMSKLSTFFPKKTE